MVVNKVYATTHDGLTQLVSARVASQVLDNGLRNASCSAETVSAAEMKKVLKSSVLRDLATILPRAGLELSLKKLLKTLKTLDSDKAAEVAGATKTALSDNGSISHDTASHDPVGDKGATVASLSVVEAAPETGVIVGAVLAPDAKLYPPPWAALSGGPIAEHPFVEHPVAEYPGAEPSTGTSVEVSKAATGLVQLRAAVEPKAVLATSVAQVLEPVAKSLKVPQVPTTLGPAARDDLLLAFAQLEHVEMVAAFEGGCVTSVRGSGFEVEALSRLGTLGLKLLGRSGELRVFYVAHSRGQLFLFPFGEVALMLIGSSELNLGLVFATLHKFKEEL